MMKTLLEAIAQAPNNETSLFFLGQAGFAIKNTHGETLTIDPYFSNCCERIYGYKRLMPMLVNPEEYKSDYLVITHEHEDHFDVDALPSLLKCSETQMVTARDAFLRSKKLGLPIERIKCIQEGETVRCGHFVVHAVFCDHGLSAPDAIGIILEVDGNRIYITGDTCLRVDRVEDIKRYGHVDLLICPINGRFGNMDAADAVRLCSEIRPGLTIPCHYWNFAEHGGDPGQFAAMMNDLLPSVPYRLMTMGERLGL